MPVLLSVILMLFSGYAIRRFFLFGKGLVDVSLLLVSSMCFYYGIGTFLGLVVAPTDLSEALLVDADLSREDLIWPLILIVVYGLFTYFPGRTLF